MADTWPSTPTAPPALSSNRSSGDTAEANARVSDSCPKFSRMWKTGIVTSDVMRRHQPLEGVHPECPDRISRIMELLQQRELLKNMENLEARQATDEEIVAAHTHEHMDYIRKLTHMDQEQIKAESCKWDSVYLHPDSEIAARFAAGSLCSATEAVCTRRVRNAVAVIRPPGHHAEEHCCMGFCIYNNVAVAVQSAKKSFGARRILIVDWDIHHGNGTQNIFANDPSVLYFSIHRHDKGKFYPYGEGGAPATIGSGDGTGFSVNVGWNQKKMGDSEYIFAFSQVLMPIAVEFDPDLVFISAGFDAARGDPLGGCNVSPECYAHLTHMLMRLAEGRVILALEGGYNLTSISESMAACTSVMIGNPVPRLTELLRPISKGAIRDVASTIESLAPYWTQLIPISLTSKSSSNSMEHLPYTLNSMKITDKISPPTTRRGTTRDLPPHLKKRLQAAENAKRGKSKSKSKSKEKQPVPEITPAPVLDAKYASALAARWYQVHSPFASHFVMDPVGALQISESIWTIRYRVVPDTGSVYDRQFSFQPKNESNLDLGWTCTSMSSWDPDLPEIVLFDNLSSPKDCDMESPSRMQLSTSMQMLDWMPTTPIGTPNRDIIPMQFTPVRIPKLQLEP